MNNYFKKTIYIISLIFSIIYIFNFSFLECSFALSPKTLINKSSQNNDSDYWVRKFLSDKEVIISIDDIYEVRFTYRYVSKKRNLNTFQDRFSIYAEYRKKAKNSLSVFEKIGQIDVDGDTINYAFSREERFTKLGEKKYVSRNEALPSISVKREISSKFSGVGKTLMILSMQVLKNKGFKTYKVEEPISSAKKFYTKILGFKKDKNNKENNGLIFDLDNQEIPIISIKFKSISAFKRVTNYLLKFV